MDTLTQLATPDDVCTRLDELVVQYMSLVDKHVNAMVKMTKCFQEGREQIAQAKYIMGPQNVSSNCYDHRMKALVGLTVTAENDHVSLRNIARETQQAEREQEQDHERHAGSAEETAGGQGGQRRRATGRGPALGSRESSAAHSREGSSESTESEEKIDTNGQTTAKKKSKEVSRDPLRWFGVFAPLPLKNAQGSFRAGLHDLSELATIQLQLQTVERQIRTLEQCKSAMIL